MKFCPVMPTGAFDSGAFVQLYSKPPVAVNVSESPIQIAVSGVRLCDDGP